MRIGDGTVTHLQPRKAALVNETLILFNFVVTVAPTVLLLVGFLVTFSSLRRIQKQLDELKASHNHE